MLAGRFILLEAPAVARAPAIFAPKGPARAGEGLIVGKKGASVDELPDWLEAAR